MMKRAAEKEAPLDYDCEDAQGADHKHCGVLDCKYNCHMRIYFSEVVFMKHFTKHAHMFGPLFDTMFAHFTHNLVPRVQTHAAAPWCWFCPQYNMQATMISVPIPPTRPHAQSYGPDRVVSGLESGCNPEPIRLCLPAKQVL